MLCSEAEYSFPFFYIYIFSKTSSEYVHRLKLRLAQPENQIYDYNQYGAPAYDAAWSIGLMLHQASARLENMTFSDKTTKRLEDFTYNSGEMKDLFFELLADIQFEGVSVSNKLTS